MLPISTAYAFLREYFFSFETLKFWIIGIICCVALESYMSSNLARDWAIQRHANRTIHSKLKRAEYRIFNLEKDILLLKEVQKYEDTLKEIQETLRGQSTNVRTTTTGTNMVPRTNRPRT